MGRPTKRQRKQPARDGPAVRAPEDVAAAAAEDAPVEDDAVEEVAAFESEEDEEDWNNDAPRGPVFGTDVVVPIELRLALAWRTKTGASRETLVSEYHAQLAAAG
mmetsp:Transcript_28143/g.87083  ORF Transcript_28143/g.87083 Transcript_28143/m.87083 type:complete len:105 (+) Transcript_28143:2166-2480(+)